jgi:hypothetical protein
MPVADRTMCSTLGKLNLILPGGTAKIGDFKYDVDLNADLKSVPEFNDLPIRLRLRFYASSIEKKSWPNTPHICGLFPEKSHGWRKHVTVRTLSSVPQKDGRCRHCDQPYRESGRSGPDCRRTDASWNNRPWSTRKHFEDRSRRTSPRS